MSRNQEFVIVEFDEKDFPYKTYFVGSTLQDVLDDTKGGKKFGQADFSNHRIVNLESARTLQLEFLEEAILCVKRGSIKSYYVGTPPKKK